MKCKYYRGWLSKGKCVIEQIQKIMTLAGIHWNWMFRHLVAGCPAADTFIYYFTVYLIDVELDFVWLGRVQWVQSLEKAGLETDFGVTTCTRSILKHPVMSQLRCQVPLEYWWYQGNRVAKEEKEESYKSRDQELYKELVTAAFYCFNRSKFLPPGLMGTMVTQSQSLVVSLGQDFMCRIARVLCYTRPTYRTF